MVGKIRFSGSFQGNFHCRWTIERFSSLEWENGQSYKSESFELERESIQWHLQLFPGGNTEDSKRYVHCTPIIKTQMRNLKTNFSVSLRNTNDDILFNINRMSTKLSRGGNPTKLMEREALISGLVNDVLVITAEVSYSFIGIKDGDDIYYCAENTPKLDVVNDLEKLLASKENTDCVISIGEEEQEDIPVHSVILGARSKVFAAMLKHDTLEKNTRRVKVTDFDRNTMDSFVEFIYTGSVARMDCNTSLELLRASDKYALDDLKSYCCNYLMSLLDDKNVYQILVSADTYNVSKLRGQAINFFCENLSKEDFEARISFFKARPELLCDIVKGMIDRKVPKSVEVGNAKRQRIE